MKSALHNSRETEEEKEGPGECVCYGKHLARHAV